MFLRSMRVAGRLYWNVIHAYRKDGRPKQRIVFSLGQHDTRESAEREWNEALEMQAAHPDRCYRTVKQRRTVAYGLMRQPDGSWRAILPDDPIAARRADEYDAKLQAARDDRKARGVVLRRVSGWISHNQNMADLRHARRVEEADARRREAESQRRRDEADRRAAEANRRLDALSAAIDEIIAGNDATA